MPPCTVIPELVYADVGAAIAWLCDAFGFRERWRAGDHRAQLSFAGGTVVLMESRTASALPGPQSLIVRVDDADAHHDRARRRGAAIVQAPEDFPYGERQYCAEDLGGHRWTFSQSIADLAPEAWGASAGPALEDHPDASLSVMLIVPDAAAAVAWYEDALGATPTVGPRRGRRPGGRRRAVLPARGQPGQPDRDQPRPGGRHQRADRGLRRRPGPLRRPRLRGRRHRRIRDHRSRHALGHPPPGRLPRSLRPPVVGRRPISPPPPPMTAIQPQLWVEPAGAAVAFYAAAFGATVLHQVGDGDDIVAQLAVGDAAFWVASASPGAGRFNPTAIGGATGRTLLVVGDPDAIHAQALAAGATRSVPRRRRARLAPRPDRRPLRPRMGDRQTARHLATLLKRGSGPAHAAVPTTFSCRRQAAHRAPWERTRAIGADRRTGGCRRARGRCRDTRRRGGRLRWRR